MVHRVEASCRPIVKRMDQFAEFVGADLIATPARESNFDRVQFARKFPLVSERREFLDNLSSHFLRVVAHGFLRPSNGMAFSGATGIITQIASQKKLEMSKYTVMCLPSGVLKYNSSAGAPSHFPRACISTFAPG